MMYVKQQYPIRLYLEVSSEQVCKSHRASHVVPVCSKVMIVVMVMMMMSYEKELERQIQELERQIQEKLVVETYRQRHKLCSLCKGSIVMSGTSKIGHA